MERLTKHSKQTSHENGICCTHFRGPECLEVGGNCAMNCKWEEAAWSRLAAYEDTGLTPEEINDLASVREIPPEAEYAINKHADSIIERLDKLLAQTDDDVRLRELAEADKDGRLVVPPCKVGDTLFRVFAGEILEHKVRNMRYLAIQGRWDIDTTPFCSYVESSIGKTIFLTREEAKKALEGKRNA
jgi:hypothetical protein